LEVLLAFDVAAGRGRLAALVDDVALELVAVVDDVRFACAAGGGGIAEDEDCLGVAGVVIGDSSASMSSAF